MTRVSLLYLLCQSATTVELESTARDLGCVDLRWVYGALHLMLPDGTRGSLRSSHARALGISDQFVWCAADSAE